MSNLFYTKIAPKNPERSISEVMDAKIVMGNKFSIQYKAANGKKKSIEYEAEDQQIANKIVSKLQTIKYNKSLEKILINIGIWKRRGNNIKRDILMSLNLLNL